LAWTYPASITYSTPLGATQLNATANVAGTFVYAPPAGTVLGAGTHTLTATFAPSEAANYQTASVSRPISVTKANPQVTWYAPAAAANCDGATASVTVNVAKAAPAVTWSDPADIVYGQALAATQLNAAANVAGTFAYSPAAGTVLNAGSQTLSVTFTPADAANYDGATASVTVNVGKAAPSITWLAPSPIVYGTALSAAQLNATANVPGTFAYSPAPGTVPGAGSATLSVTFTPTDSANHDGSTTSRSLTVTSAPLTIRANDAAKVFGAPLPPFAATGAGFVNGDSLSSLSGSLILSTSATESSTVGGYAITPSGVSSPNYAIAFAHSALTIARASTATSVAASPNPDGLNQAVTLMAAVSVVAPGAGIPSGIVQFFDS